MSAVQYSDEGRVLSTGGRRLRLLACADISSGYDWAEARVYKDDSTGEYFWAEEHGCSCDSFESNTWSLSGFTRTRSIAEAAAGLRRWDREQRDSHGYENPGMDRVIRELYVADEAVIAGQLVDQALT